MEEWGRNPGEGCTERKRGGLADKLNNRNNPLQARDRGVELVSGGERKKKGRRFTQRKANRRKKGGVIYSWGWGALE